MLDCSLYRAWLPSGFSQLAQPSLFLMHLSSARQKSDLPKSVLVFVNKVWCGVTLCGKFCTAGNGPIHLLNPPQKIEEILHQREWCRIRSWCLPLCRSQTNGRYQGQACANCIDTTMLTHAIFSWAPCCSRTTVRFSKTLSGSPGTLPWWARNLQCLPDQLFSSPCSHVPSPLSLLQ